MPAAPPHSGSTFCKYKGTHSMVLVVICDASYKSTIVGIGAQGRQSDRGIFKASAVTNYFENAYGSLPGPEPLLPCRPKVPYVIVGDAAFQQSKYMKKPRAGPRVVGTLLQSLENYIEPPSGKSALVVSVKVLKALRFFASCSYQTVIGFNVYTDVSQSSVSRCVKEVSAA
ncbi:hypothetical protein CBL_10633 [Carabus blaptoides fortunei]